jgi:hypothetical protein
MVDLYHRKWGKLTTGARISILSKIIEVGSKRSELYKRRTATITAQTGICPAGCFVGPVGLGCRGLCGRGERENIMTKIGELLQTADWKSEFCNIHGLWENPRSLSLQ